MPAGRYRDFVTLQAPPAAEVLDPGGEPSTTWADVGTFPAEVVEMSGSEAVRNKQIVGESTHRVSLRGTGVEITRRHRLVWLNCPWGPKTLNVADAPYNQRRDEWTLLCQSRDET